MSDGQPTADEVAGKDAHLREISEIKSEYINPNTTKYLGHIEKFTTSEQQSKINVIERLSGLSRNPNEISNSQPKRRKQALYHQFVTVTQELLKNIH